MRKLIFLFSFMPFLAWAAQTTITDNGNYLTSVCYVGKGRVSVMDGGGGYDSGTVTFQYQTSIGDWENACSTAADCQWSSGDSGAVVFDLGAPASVRLNVASVAAASADIDVELICAN